MSRNNRLGRDPLRKRTDFGGTSPVASRFAELSKNPTRIPRDRSLSNSVELRRPRFPKLLEIARWKRDLRNFGDRSIGVSPVARGRGSTIELRMDNNSIFLLRNYPEFLDSFLKVILTPYCKVRIFNTISRMQMNRSEANAVKFVKEKLRKFLLFLSMIISQSRHGHRMCLYSQSLVTDEFPSTTVDK